MPLFTPPEETPEDREFRIRIKNRRRRYLELHPEYFENPDLEFADPLLYDRLVRRFQTRAEREQELRTRGFAGVLHADLLRADAQRAALLRLPRDGPLPYIRAPDGSMVAADYYSDDDEVDDHGWPLRREQARVRWRAAMELRFLRGADPDFDYATVDDSSEFDDRAEEDRAALERYLASEPAEFVCEGSPKGETGVQDF